MCFQIYGVIENLKPRFLDQMALERAHIWLNLCAYISSNWMHIGNEECILNKKGRDH